MVWPLKGEGAEGPSYEALKPRLFSPNDIFIFLLQQCYVINFAMIYNVMHLQSGLLFMPAHYFFQFIPSNVVVVVVHGGSLYLLQYILGYIIGYSARCTMN
jgi:hypothetical protein